MASAEITKSSPARVMVFGAGAPAQGVLHNLKQNGAQVYTYLTSEAGHYSPSLEGETFFSKTNPNPCNILKQKEIDLVIPMSIEWATADWVDEFLSLNIPILAPIGKGMQLERDRFFAAGLCEKFDIPVPKSFVAKNRLEAEKILHKNPMAYVIKNPLCSPGSPIHTIVCETVEETRSWLNRINYQEGVFLQEYMGRREAGHIAFISGGEIYSLVTNQEYKRAFDGNMGIVTGAPVGGLIEKDPEDKYNLAKELLHPLLPWFREVGFNGPVQVTAIWRDKQWSVLEYNVRIGVTCGPIILEMLQDPLKVLFDVGQDQITEIRFKDDLNFGCSITLAGYGFPYKQIDSPSLPVRVLEKLNCHVWWNEVAANSKGELQTTGQRVADVVAIESTLEKAIQKAYENIPKIHCLGSYYRTDIGQSLWPPGSD
ncbi:MAG: phosphoribosylamine--glycine ligase [Caldithrix sp.]|nr:MAG: phosphoribosylamine--glycine ligase [Caldithrix sp.]